MGALTEKEEKEFLSSQQVLADKWRAKLADPALQAEIQAGRAHVSPLVTKLLDAFPPLPPAKLKDK